MTNRISTAVAGLAFAAAMTLNAGPQGVQLGVPASAQSAAKKANACVAMTVSKLRNPGIYLDPNRAPTLAADLKALNANLRKVALGACNKARGNPKQAIAFGKRKVMAMLKMKKKPGVSPAKRKAVAMALKKRLIMLRKQCASLNVESRKIAKMGKRIKDPRMMKAFKHRIAKSKKVRARCVRISRSMTNQANILDSNKKIDRRSLEQTIKDVEQMQEDVRDKREMANTAFQNFDQKSNQLYNLLSQVMKTMNEMRHGTVKNMLK